VRFFSLVVVAVVWGLIYTSAHFSESLFKPGGGLLDGLIANGVSVIISTILITPLTAYFVLLRREQQLVPVRKSFVSSIANAIDGVAISFIHHFHLYGLSVKALNDSMAGNTLAVAFETFNKNLKLGLSHFRESERMPLSQSQPILTKVIEDAKGPSTNNLHSRI
jgi:hypothetical protein